MKAGSKLHQVRLIEVAVESSQVSRCATGRCEHRSRKDAGGSKNGAREANFEAETSRESPAGLGGRWNVLGDGWRCIGGDCADNERIVANSCARAAAYSR